LVKDDFALAETLRRLQKPMGKASFFDAHVFSSSETQHSESGF